MVTTRTTQHPDERRRKEEEELQQHRQQQQQDERRRREQQQQQHDQQRRQQRQVFVLGCVTILLTSILAVTAARLAYPILRRRRSTTTMNTQTNQQNNADDAAAAGLLVLFAVVNTIHTGITWVLVWRFWCFPSWQKWCNYCCCGCHSKRRTLQRQFKLQRREQRTEAKKQYILHRRELRASMAITVGMIVLGFGSIASSSFALAFFVNNHKNHNRSTNAPSGVLLPFVTVNCGLYSLIAILIGRSYFQLEYPQCQSLFKYWACTISVLIVVGSIGITTWILQKQKKEQDYWWLPPILGMVWGGIIVLIGMSSLCRAYLVRRIPISSLTWWRGTAIYQQAERKYGPDEEDDDQEEDEEDSSEEDPEEQDLEEDETTEELSTTRALCRRPRRNIPDRGVFDTLELLQLQTNRHHQCAPDIDRNAKAVDDEDGNVEDFRKNLQHEFQILGGGGSDNGTTLV